LGIEFVSIDEPLLIECATVIIQPKVVRYWTKDCVLALRGLLNVEAPPPTPGSLLYLSRHGEASMVADRTHPSLQVEEIVRTRGGKVLRTSEASLDDYVRASKDAETLLFDHGSAAYNMVYWQPRRVIEFTSDDWWMNSFLFFADALGVDDYAILRSDLPDLEMRLDAVLKKRKELS
jgi:capsular polysaccharide biosynthesis protein